MKKFKPSGMDFSKPILVLGVLIAISVQPTLAQNFDILIRNGRILDGSGNPDYRADVGIRGDEIVAIGALKDDSAKRTINASGMFVVPGFIDMHSHADRGLVSEDIERRKAYNLVAQGITTVVVAPDGRNPMWPIADEIAAYRKFGIALNVVPMVGHGTVRGQVMGDDYERFATAEEIEKMQSMVRMGMEQGGWGMGAAPEYRPGRFSNTEEIIELAKVIAEFDGFYYAHQRSQSPLPRWQTPSIVKGWRLTGTDGMKETIRIGREARIRVVGSHIKAKGPTTWGHSSVDIMLIDRAREEGVQVYLDQYPYETFGGGPVSIIPPWGFAPPGTDRTGGNDDPQWRNRDLFADYKNNLRQNLSDPETKELLIKDIEYIIDLKGGADRLVIIRSPNEEGLFGRTLAEIAKEQGKTPVEKLIEFAMNSDASLRSGAMFRPIAGSAFDVENYMKKEYTATCTDGGVSLTSRPGQHPRYYGAFPRKIAYYVKEKGVISLPFAIRSSTGLAAQIIRLPDRGYIRPNYKADIVIFDFDKIQDRATILDPSLFPEGIEYVLVNGEFTVDGGKRTGSLSGKVLVRHEIQK